MRCLRRLLFVLLLFSFVSQSLFCRTLSEEQYQTLVQNLENQEIRLEVLDSQLLKLSMELEIAQKQLIDAESQLKKSELLQKRAEESLKTVNSKYKQRIICTSIFTLIIGVGVGCFVTNKIELHCKTK